MSRVKKETLNEIIIKTAVGVNAEAIFDYFYWDKSRATSGVLRDTNDATTMVKFEVQHWIYYIC